MVESSSKGWKTLWEEKKLLVTSNFSSSHSVSKKLVQQARKTKACLGKDFKGKAPNDLQATANIQFLFYNMGVVNIVS